MFRQFFPGREVVSASITEVFVGLSSIDQSSLTLAAEQDVFKV
jgi:hypothetical protein